jgi:hypothetical protein
LSSAEQTKRLSVICPLIQDPQEECYCSNLSSLNTEDAVHFCAGNYKKCKIYQKEQEKKDK